MSKKAIKIGYSLSLSGPLAANGQTARLAHEIWQDNINTQGGIHGRQVELVCVDDKSDATTVEGIYRLLLSEEKVDLLLGGYGNNSISPAMPVVMENEKFFVGLMGLGVNNALNYDRFFAMIPTGPDPNAALTVGFFEAASRQVKQGGTVAIVAADADFTKNPIVGARANADQFGLKVISETKYSLATEDFTDVLSKLGPDQPDIVFFCSYLNDSVGLVRAMNDSNIDPAMVGGAMIGPQSSAVQTKLGPLLNGLVNYEYWLPTPAMAFQGVYELISSYQERALGTPADALGYYVAPFAYAQLQVLGQAIHGTQGTNDSALAEYTRSTQFSTVVGDVRFGTLGEWATPRVLTVQFQGIGSNDISEFAKPEARVVIAPKEYESGDPVVPFRTANAAR
jgi:branched-chain amino acid transport system substrate-binding protein